MHQKHLTSYLDGKARDLRVHVGLPVVLAGLVWAPSSADAQTPLMPLTPSSAASSPLEQPYATHSPPLKLQSGKLPAGASVTSLPASFSSLDWKSLTSAQHTALKPLADSWAGLSDAQKRKWITLSANYPQMSAAEQTKLHERMAQWAALTTRQREHARLNFADAKQITPEMKSEKWQAYQALSAEEKQKLAISAQPKPPRTALAAQPVASDKINRMPLTKSALGAVLPASAPSVSKNTLLVKPKPPTPPTLPKAPASSITHGVPSQ